MSTTFWSGASAIYLMSAMAPWSTQTYWHSWWDAAFYGLAAFFALKAVTSAILAVAQGEG
jgi:hypothetical protein